MVHTVVLKVASTSFFYGADPSSQFCFAGGRGKIGWMLGDGTAKRSKMAETPTEGQ